MIQKFITRFDAKREWLRGELAKAQPEGYEAIVKLVVTALQDEDDYSAPDPERITRIDHGDYQGTLFFVIAAYGYQPSDFWAVKVGYGSCSGCDTFEAIRSYDGETPTPEQVEQYMTLAVHVLQGLREIGGDA